MFHWQRIRLPTFNINVPFNKMHYDRNNNGYKKIINYVHIWGAVHLKGKQKLFIECTIILRVYSRAFIRRLEVKYQTMNVTKTRNDNPITVILSGSFY